VVSSTAPWPLLPLLDDNLGLLLQPSADVANEEANAEEEEQGASCSWLLCLCKICFGPAEQRGCCKHSKRAPPPSVCGLLLEDASACEVSEQKLRSAKPLVGTNTGL